MKQAQKENERQAAFKMGMAMLIFGTIGIFRRYIPLSSALLACLRGLAGAFFLFLIVRLRGRKPLAETSLRTKISFAFSGCLIGLNWMFLFEAYRYTSVGIATLCYYMQPVIVILLSPFLFHEKLTWPRFLCVLTAALGMVFITRIEPQGSLLGILYGLAAAFLYAGVVICNKKAPPADAYDKAMIQLFCAGLILVPFLAVRPDDLEMSLTPLSFAFLAVVCLVHTGLAYVLYFDSLPALSAQTIAVMGYLDPLFALFLSAVILHEPMTPMAWLGAALIMTGTLAAETIGRK